MNGGRHSDLSSSGLRAGLGWVCGADDRLSAHNGLQVVAVLPPNGLAVIISCAGVNFDRFTTIWIHDNVYI